MRAFLFGLVRGFIKPVLVAGIDSIVAQSIAEIKETGKVSDEGLEEIRKAVEKAANDVKTKLKLN